MKIFLVERKIVTGEKSAEWEIILAMIIPTSICPGYVYQTATGYIRSPVGWDEGGRLKGAEDGGLETGTGIHANPD